MIFIGPPSQAIYDMGIKNKSKELMIAAGVPVVPGYHGQSAASNLDALKEEALKLVLYSQNFTHTETLN